jgi:hypothetical protein
MTRLQPLVTRPVGKVDVVDVFQHGLREDHICGCGLDHIRFGPGANVADGAVGSGLVEAEQVGAEALKALGRQRRDQTVFGEDVRRKVVVVEPGKDEREFRLVRDGGAILKQRDEIIEDFEIALGRGVGHDIQGDVFPGAAEQSRQADAQRVARPQLGDGLRMGIETITLERRLMAQPYAVTVAGGDGAARARGEFEEGKIAFDAAQDRA